MELREPHAAKSNRRAFGISTGILTVVLYAAMVLGASGDTTADHVLGQMGFRPKISPNLKEMDPRIFRAGPMGLSRSFAEWPARPRRVA